MASGLMNGSTETRSRVLQAATEVFAAEGYRNATLREICRRAEANIAAVNYHFRDKEQLYAAVIEHAMRVAAERLPRASQVPGLPAETRLRQFIHEMMESMLGAKREAVVLRLMVNETAEPTPALDLMIERVIGPFHRQLAAIVAELLGPGATEEEIRDCAGSVVAQCTSYHHSAAVIQRLHGLELHDEAVIDRLTDHIFEFSLGGIRAMTAARSSREKVFSQSSR